MELFNIELQTVKQMAIRNACSIGRLLIFYDFFKTVLGDDVEKLRIDAIVIHCSGLSC